MEKGVILKILKAPSDWEIIQQVGGFADIGVELEFGHNPDDDTETEIDFKAENVYARIVNEESGEFVTPPTRIEPKGKGFLCELKNVPCGGPYLLDFILLTKTGEGVIIGEKRRHFYVGDVYIIAGQSNAAGMAKGFLTEKSEMGVHVLRNLEHWDIASQPFNDLDYSKCGMFLTFAKKIKERANMPIGLIPAAMGGSPLSRWIKDEKGDLYEKLIGVLKRHNIKAKAILWYQGCTDVWDNTDTEYLERFKKFVKSARKDLGNLPIFTFQLNRQRFKDALDENGREYGFIREAQRRAAKEIDGVYVIPTIDCLGMTDFIHNNKASNLMLGERLAIQVLDKLYGIGFGADAPDIVKAHLESERKIVLKFDNVTEFLYAFNSTAIDFPIIAEDEKGVIELSDYEISADTVTLLLGRTPSGDVFVSGQVGNNQKNIIIDYGRQIPMLCFSKFKVDKEK